MSAVASNKQYGFCKFFPPSVYYPFILHKKLYGSQEKNGFSLPGRLLYFAVISTDNRVL